MPNNDDYIGYPKSLFGNAGCKRSEADFILGYLPQGGSMLEIGTYHGFTIGYMATERPDAKFVSVDPFPQKRLDIKKDEYPIGNVKLWEQNKRTNNELFIGDIIQFHLANKGAEFDVVFVDGNHYHDAVMIDLENSIHLTKNDGVIAVHDYGKIAHDDVDEAVNEFVANTEWHIIGMKESVVILKKR